MAKSNTINVKTSAGTYNGTAANDKFIIEAGINTVTINANGEGTDSLYFKSPHPENNVLANNTNDKFEYSSDEENPNNLIITRTYSKYTKDAQCETGFDTIAEGIEAGYAYLGPNEGWYKEDKKTDKVTLKDYFNDTSSSIKTLQYASYTLNILDELIAHDFVSNIKNWAPNSKGVITGTGLKDEITIKSTDEAFADITSDITVNAGNGNDVIRAESFYSQKVTLNGGDGNDRITAYKGNHTVINGGDGNDTITVGMTPNSLTMGTISDGVYKSEINTGKGDNEVHVISSYKNTETHITPTKGENLTIYYEASVASTPETGGFMLDLATPDATVFLDESEFTIYRKGNDIVVERNYEYFQNVMKVDTTGETQETIYFDVQTFKEYAQSELPEKAVDTSAQGNYNTTRYLDGSIKYFNPLTKEEVTPEFEVDKIYVTPLYTQQAQAKDTIIIDDIVNKYDASSLKIVVGYTESTSYVTDPLKERFTFDLIKGTVYNNNTQTYEDIRYYTYDENDIKNKNKFSATNHDEEINFADYSKNKKLTINAGSGDDKITGTKNDDTINTGSGNNTVDGGKGNDTINLGNGQNIVKFGTGSGHDTIKNSTYEGTALAISDEEIDGAEDLTFVRNGNHLDVKISDKDYVTVNNYFKTDALDTIAFANETVASINDYLSGNAVYDVNGDNTQGFLVSTGNLTGYEYFNNNITGTAKANKINGANYENSVDILEGGKGNDTLTGGAGENYLVFQKGDGKDTVKLSENEDLHLVYKAEAGATLTASDFTYTRSGKDVIVSRTGTKDTITLKDFAYNKPDSVKLDIYNQTEGEYGEATTVNLSEYKYELTGTAKNAKKGIGATITGSNLNETITGTKYKDTLTSGAGEDTLIGGKGNDILNSGAGKTTFEFNTGDGADTVNEADSLDTLLFKDKAVTALSFTADKNSLKISYAEGDAVTLTDWFKAEDNFATKVVDTESGDLSENLAELHSNVATWMNAHTDFASVGDALASEGEYVEDLQAYFNFNAQ